MHLELAFLKLREKGEFRDIKIVFFNGYLKQQEKLHLKHSCIG